MPHKDPEVARQQWREWYEKNKTQRAEYAVRYRAENRDRIKTRVKERYAAHAEEEAARYREWFSKNAERKRAADRERMAAKPIEEKRAYMRKWSDENRERVRDNGAKRRARVRNAPEVEKIDRKAIYDRDGGRCHICRKKVPYASYTLDHLVPLARGGSHTATNLSVAHKSCNSSRGAGRLPAQLLIVG